MDLSLGEVCDEAVPTGTGSESRPATDTGTALPTRQVFCMDALSWLENIPDGGLPGSVFTSLPDINLIFKKLPVGEYAIFLQSDCRIVERSDHVEWIDKGHLCASAAERGGATCMWHKLVLLSNIAKRTYGRPSYSHLICFRKGELCRAYRSGLFGIPDVFDRGHMIWPKGIGLNCCLAAVSFLKTVNTVHTIVDPFCGIGTVLAMSNCLGFNSVGVEISAKRCMKARGLDVGEAVRAMEHGERSMLGCTLKKSMLLSEFELIATNGPDEALLDGACEESDSEDTTS